MEGIFVIMADRGVEMGRWIFSWKKAGGVHPRAYVLQFEPTDFICHLSNNNKTRSSGDIGVVGFFIQNVVVGDSGVGDDRVLRKSLMHIFSPWAALRTGYIVGRCAGVRWPRARKRHAP